MYGAVSARCFSSFRRNTNVQHYHLLVTLVSRFTPDIFISVWIASGTGSSIGGAYVIAHWERFLIGHDRSEFCRYRQYLVLPGNLAWIVFVLYYICSVVAESFMAFSRSSEMDQAGPSYASSARCQERFWALHWTCDLIDYKTLHRTFPTSWNYGPSGPVRLLSR